ncbi:MAG: sigma factor-like helix-turn-helix DNA-binding protein [Patescibacteria group bacterium]
MNNLLLRLNNQKKFLQSKLNREPTIEELSDYSGIPVKRIEHLFNVNNVGSLNIFVGEEKNTEMIDLVEDYRIGTEERIINNLVKKEIESFLCEKLTPRDQKIIEYRCGINGRRYTLEEVGDIFGITRERVRQIQKKTIQRMKTNKKIMELV